jgi:L-alanine-DL-glutamate epimerase-like enolase superfamily enzyme
MLPISIDDVSLTLFGWDGLPEVRYGQHNPPTPKKSQIGLLTIRSDSGIEGHAFLGSSFRGAHLDAVSLIEILKPVVMGQNPLDRERLHRALAGRWRATTWRAIGALDVALWDIAGKVAGLPIHQLLGTYRRRVRAYASSGTLVHPQAYVDQALGLRERGFTAYKIHPPAGLGQCIEVCRAVRAALGPDTVLMLDPAGVFSFPDAMRLGRAIEELAFYWYEDPLQEDDLYNYVKLREKLDIPIMATEYSPGSFHAYAPWILAKATDYLRGDVAIKGGLTPVLKTAHLADAFQMNYEIHHGGNSLNNVANLHAMMAIKNCEFFEVLLPNEAQKYGLLNDIEVDAEGYVHAMDGPGLGASIDFDLIKRKTLQILR